MTAQRQENKGRGFKIAVFAALAWCVLPSAQLFAAATERVVVNRHTGLAIDGFDPVAYFTDGSPVPGVPDVELSDRDAVWRFRNEANRAAFIANPEIYSPRFGGYDPTDIAKGNPVPGRAQMWVIYRERLYLFSREDSHDAFAASPDAVIARAEAQWPAVQKSLSNY